ncbi:MAG: hypothetical protein JSR97_10145 [Verrucomicrobia bacterium]|nr:hypothetical protein [Verrucomicrobiota bacterium]
MSDQSKMTKQKPAFYIFEQLADGQTRNIGAAFYHKKGNGINLVIAGKCYPAFPPKLKL